MVPRDARDLTHVNTVSCAPAIVSVARFDRYLTLNTSPPARLVGDPALIRKYGGSGPRYTSYPTADRFVEAFDAAAYRHWLQTRHIGGFASPLVLSVPLPFCGTICYYCGCNKIVTKDHGRS